MRRMALGVGLPLIAFAFAFIADSGTASADPLPSEAGHMAARGGNGNGNQGNGNGNGGSNGSGNASGGNGGSGNASGNANPNGNGSNIGDGSNDAAGNNAGGRENVAVCHAGSEVNPHYVAIEIPQPALQAHLGEHSLDFVITPEKPCPPVEAQPPPGGQPTGELKVCKTLASGTTVASDALFTFSVGSRTVAVAPGTCTLLSSVAAGPITVTETGPSGFQVTDITFAAGTGTTSPSTGSATATGVAAQTTEVQFTNQSATTTGFVQICKETTPGVTAQPCDPSNPTGTFSFTSPSFTGTQKISVVAGATQPVCGPLTQVPAGSVAITEATGAGFVLTGVRTLGSGSLVDLSGTTATVQVMAGGPEQMTEVIFKNAAPGDP